MAETLAQARARWSNDHGIPWEQSAAGQQSVAYNQRKARGGAGPKATTPSPPLALAGLHQGLKAGGGGTVAGGFFGILLFFTLRAYVSGGTPGVKSFYAAKFANRTSSQPNPSPTAAPSAPAQSSGTPPTASAPATNLGPLISPISPQGLLGNQAPPTTTGPTLGAAPTLTAA